MDLSKMIAELTEEKNRIEHTMQILSTLGTTSKRRGRPPAWMSNMKAAAKDTEGKRAGRTFSAAQKKAQALKMKAYWAAKKKLANKKAGAKAKGAKKAKAGAPPVTETSLAVAS